MPDFHAFLTQKYHLYADTEIKVNLTVKQLIELNEEFVRETAPVFEVKVVEAEITNEEIKDLTEIRNYFGEHDKTIFEHTAYSKIDKILKKLNKKL